MCVCVCDECECVCVCVKTSGKKRDDIYKWYIRKVWFIKIHTSNTKV